jgi:protein tyrosine phosphatase (PTP) superfamily phosphohydrolase (DUF442 family)
LCEFCEAQSITRRRPDTKQDGQAVAVERVERVHQAGLDAGIHAAEGFIQQQDLRVLRQRAMKARRRCPLAAA